MWKIDIKPRRTSKLGSKLKLKRRKGHICNLKLGRTIKWTVQQQSEKHMQPISKNPPTSEWSLSIAIFGIDGLI